MASAGYAYQPDVVFPPGDTLRELLQARHMTQAELAEKLSMTEKAVSHLLNGKMGLTQETALKLERVLGVDASFWNNLEARYQEWRVRQDEAERLEKHKAFLKRFPFKEMVKRGWLRGGSNTTEKVRELLNFFGVADPEAWDAHWGSGKLAMFRKTNAKSVSKYATSAWLRAGEIAARGRDLPPYDRSKFLDALDEIVELVASPPEDFCLQMIDLCAQAGVALVLMPQLPKTGISGATRWIHKTPIIQLSLRGKYDDYFWFAFFHESAHVLLHGKTDVFWRGVEPDSEEHRRKEDEANEWAANFLIPRSEWEDFVAAHANFYEHDIVRFANRVCTSPGVVVGRLQNEGRMAYKFNNHLRIPFRWAECE